MSYKLEDLSVALLNKHKGNDAEFRQALTIFGWANLPVEIAAPYASQDSLLTIELLYKLYPEFCAQGFDGDLWDWEQRFIRVISGMECTGTRVDMRLARQQVAQGRSRMAEIHDEIGYNPLSGKDLETVLIGELGLPVVKRSAKTGKPSFDKYAMAEYEEKLAAMNSPLAERILEYRGWNKAVSSYWDNYIRLVSPDGRLRPNYKLHGTVSTRLSCERPNLQQIPRKGSKPWNEHTKQGFIPAEGFGLWEADYSQLELRLATAYAANHDPEGMQPLLDIFANPSRDVFTEMSTQLGFSRFETKTLAYTVQYGGGANRISSVFNVDLQRGAMIRDHWFDTYPGFRQVSRTASQRCKNYRYLRLWSGRRRHFIDPEAESHKAFNSAIQGGAAEIVKRALVRIADEVVDDNCRMLLQVHDSAVAEIAEGKEEEYGKEIKRIMEDVQPDFGVTFKVDFHKWGE